MDRPDGQHRPNRPDHPQGAKPGYRPPPPNVIDHARRHFHDRDHYWTPDWYRHHPHVWYPPHIPSYRWWYRPSWYDTWGWFGSGFFIGVTANRPLNPYPYYYGDNIVYRGDMVYVNGIPYVSAAEYYRQASELANSTTIIVEREVVKEQPAIQPDIQKGNAPEMNRGTEPMLAPAEPKDDDYLPMGSFTVLDAEGKEKTDVLIQLATNKKGQIRGNYYDEKDGTARQLAGAVDSKSQRVALRFSGDEKTVMECGLWNLTQDTVPFLIHRNENETEQWTLVRIVKEDKEEGDTEEELAP